MKLSLVVFSILVSISSVLSQNYTFDTITTGIREPTSFVFLPNGNFMVNQQHDSAKIISSSGQLISCFWNFRDSCALGGESGLIGVCLDPDYTLNRYIYFYYIHYITNYVYRIVRLTENNNNGTNPVIIFNDSTASNGSIHFAGNMRFGKDGKLYVSIGDNASSGNAQSLSTFKGKILRINSDGTIPADNPFYDDGNPRTGNDDRIWAYGLRNSFDLTFSPFNDSLYATENGSSANDEINFIRKGKNYGWPICSGYCVPYNPLFKQPMDTIWGPGGTNYAPTGILIYNGSQMPELYGKLIITGTGAGIYSGIIKCNLGNLPFLDTITSHSVISSMHGCTSLQQGSDDYIYLTKYFPGRLLRMKHSTVGINELFIPVTYSLKQNYPNPFNPLTNINFNIGRESFVSIKIYDVTGKEIASLINENKQPGSYEAVWNAENYPSGVYFYRLTAEEFSEEKKMVLIK